MKETSANIRRFLTRKCAGLGIPVSGIFELTPRCNLQCKMCYVRLTPAQMAPIGQELSARKWLRLAREAKDAGMTFLLLTGGEPTLRGDFPEIYEGLAKMGFSISINTNGTLLSPSLRTLWHDLPPAQVNVTLYGVCRDDYAALCSNPDAFDSVVDGLDWLRGEGILVHLNTTIVPSNYAKWEQIEQFARDRGLELRLTNYCFPPARRGICDARRDFFRLSPEEAGRLAVQDLFFVKDRIPSSNALPTWISRLKTTAVWKPVNPCTVPRQNPSSGLPGTAGCLHAVCWINPLCTRLTIPFPKAGLVFDSFAVPFASAPSVLPVRFSPHARTARP